MIWITLVIIFISSFIAFTLSAICGGGAGLMLIPLLGRLLPVSQVPAALSIGTFSSSVTRLLVFKKYIRWEIVIYFMPAALPAVWLGAWLLKYLNPVYLEFVMGIFLISNLPAVFRQSKEPELNSKPAHITLVIIGFLAGFLSGITGAVGLLFNRFYLRYGLTKEEIVATRAANEILLHLIKIVLYTLFGLISTKVFAVGAVVAISAITSTWAAKYILPKLGELVFRKIGYAAMVLSGVIMLQQAIQRQGFALEFTYNEGFEFEQAIPVSELTERQRQDVYARQPQADRINIEVVYSIGEKSYEAYYFLGDRLIGKYKFR